MAPRTGSTGSLLAVYNSYKEGTSRITTWLVETAADIGIELRHNSSEPGQLVNVGEFLRLGNAIAEASLPVTSAILRTFDNVIAARKKCSDWYGGAQEQDSNRSHAYFIHVLESVAELLSKCPRKQQSKSDSSVHSIATKAVRTTMGPKANIDAPKKLSNLFEHLELHDTIPAEALSPTSSVSKNTQLANPSHTPQSKQQPPLDDTPVWYELEEDVEGQLTSALMAYSLLYFETMVFTTDIWARFRTGGTGLIGAALTTNAALDKLRWAEERIWESFSDSLTRSELTDKIIKCIARSKDSGDGVRNDEHLLWLHKMLKVAGARFGSARMEVPPIANIRNPAAVDENFEVGEQKPDSHGYVPALVRVTGVILQTILLYHAKIPIPMEDEALRRLRVLLNTGELHVWMVVAWYVLVEALIQTADQKERARDMVIKVGERARENVRLVLSFDFGRVCCDYRSGRDQYADLLRLLATFVNGNPVQRAKNIVFGEDPKRTHSDFLRDQPILCGLMAYALTAQQFYGTLFMANQRRVFTNGTHIYNAAKQYNLAPAWPDFDLLCSTFNSQDLWLGKPPTRKQNLFQRIALINGTSIRSFASNTDDRHHGCLISSRRDRASVTIPPPWSTFMDRWWLDSLCHYKAMPDAGVDYLNQQYNHWKSVHGHDNAKVGSAAISALFDDPSAIVSSTWSAFLRRMCLMLDASEHLVHMDWHAMMRKTTNLLVAIQKDLTAMPELTPSLTGLRTPWLHVISPQDIVIEQIAKIPELVLWPDSCTQFQKHSGCKDHNQCKRGYNCLPIAAARLKTLIEAEGSKELQAAELFVTTLRHVGLTDRALAEIAEDKEELNKLWESLEVDNEELQDLPECPMS